MKRPTVDAKHRDRQAKLAADMAEYERNGGKVTVLDMSARARPPVDAMEDMIIDGYRINEDRRE